MVKKFLCVVTVCLLCASCGTAPENGEKAGADKGSAAKNSSSKANSPSAVPYYSGGGGKGVSITIVAPEGKNLGQEDSHLPSLVQNVISGDFTKYSAMSVKDWASLDRVLAEIESVVYTENGDFIAAGNIAKTQYLLTGELVKTGGAYALQLVITDAKTGDNKASYAKSVSYQELSSLEALNAAAADLLGQMGVTLTQAGKDALLGAGGGHLIEAETALAKGAAAQRNGSTAAALNYYSQAADLQAGLAEADRRLAQLSKQIESGDIRQNIRNDIERREAWKNLLDEAIAFYQQNPFYNLVYLTKPLIGDVNYRKNPPVVPVSYEFWFEPNAGYYAMLKIIRALASTEKADAWNLKGEIKDLMQAGKNSRNRIVIGAELLDEQGGYIASDGAIELISAEVPKTSPSNLAFIPADSLKADGVLEVDFGGAKHLNETAFNFEVDPSLVSGGMRLSDFKLLVSESDFRQFNLWKEVNVKHPFTGAIRVIPSEKPIEEYYRGRRNVVVKVSGDRIYISARFSFFPEKER